MAENKSIDGIVVRTLEGVSSTQCEVLFTHIHVRNDENNNLAVEGLQNDTRREQFDGDVHCYSKTMRSNVFAELEIAHLNLKRLPRDTFAN